jgi:3-deoxy-7-phosphoheptulonate synthase
MSHLPIIVDPSHATGKRSLVPVMARSALVAGAHGLMVERHPEPEKALCDGAQSLDPLGFTALMGDLERIEKFLAELADEPTK